MKNKLFIPAIAAACAVLASTGCKKSLPTVYDDSHGVYFFTGDAEGAMPIMADSIELSFLDISGSEHTFDIKVMTRGRVDYNRDRRYKVAAVKKTETPADPEYVWANEDEYSFGEMVVPKGEAYGLFKMTIKKSDRLVNGVVVNPGTESEEIKDVEVEVDLEIQPSDDFPDAGIYNLQTGKVNMKTLYKVKFSNLLAQPTLWSGNHGVVNYFGKYGRAKYAFTIDVLVKYFGSSYFDWSATQLAVSYSSIMGFMTGLLKMELENYKANNAADPAKYPPIYYEGTTNWIAFGRGL